MDKIQEKLVREEQKALDKLIHDMDQALIKLDKKLTYEKLQAKKAKESCLPDAYGMLVSAEHEKMEARKRMNNIRKGRDELYETHLLLEASDERGTDKEDIKIGLHTYISGGRVFIMSWKMPLCRHYILDNAAEEYDGIVKGKHGEEYETHYQLELKRQVSLFFDSVKSVTQIFPVLNEEMEQVLADEFLIELLNRRSNQEFKNIVFSIQKKQGEIIQTQFEQNLIVQGCAGSGKSMIMLHRLPIIIYDNPNSLDRNNLYIITPSITYIQMANNMRIDLEIEDLQMGTLEQYYNHVLAKYGCKENVYGEINPSLSLSKEDEKYIYSSDCIKDIQAKIMQIIDGVNVNYAMCFYLLDLEEELKVPTIPAVAIRQKLVKIQTLITENEKRLQSYYRKFRKLYEEIEEFSRLLETRKIAVGRSVSRRITGEQRLIEDYKTDLKKIINPKDHKVRYQNRINAIKVSEGKIAQLEAILESVNINTQYFEKLKGKAEQIRKITSQFAIVKKEQREIKIEELYQLIEIKIKLCDECEVILNDTVDIGDPYSEHQESIATASEKIRMLLKRLKETDDFYLPYEYINDLIQAKTYYEDVQETIVSQIYLSIMEKIGQKPDEKDRLDALECSPYLYLQVLYQFKGTPNGMYESLITIDEAQNLAPEELRLIKKVNGNKVVLNLFGDVKQHIEKDKGIDSWNDIEKLADFKIEYLHENYRNARQITEYCNERFNLNMRAINLDGTGVHKICDAKEFEHTFHEIFRKPKNLGLSCIIVSDIKEANTLLIKADDYLSRIHNMTEGVTELERNKWNLMTVRQAKGLEFETVFAITGRMSENEKYISYTRALDELYVYDKEMKLEENTEIVPTQKEKQHEKKRSERKKRVKRKIEEVKGERNYYDTI